MPDNGFTNGLLGIPSGGSMNGAGLMLGAAARSSDHSASAVQEKPLVPCKAYEVRSGFSEECVHPSQLRENIGEISVMLNLVMVATLIFFVISYKDLRGRYNRLLDKYHDRCS